MAIACYGFRRPARLVGCAPGRVGEQRVLSNAFRSGLRHRLAAFKFHEENKKHTEDMAIKSYDEFCKFIAENKTIREILGGDAVCKRTDVLRMCERRKR